MREGPYATVRGRFALEERECGGGHSDRGRRDHLDGHSGALLAGRRRRRRDSFTTGGRAALGRRRGGRRPGGQDRRRLDREIVRARADRGRALATIARARARARGRLRGQRRGLDGLDSGRRGAQGSDELLDLGELDGLGGLVGFVLDDLLEELRFDVRGVNSGHGHDSGGEESSLAEHTEGDESAGEGFEE
jgi:hypothetical protein